MAAKKVKTLYRCSQCDHTTPAWLGQCPNCKSWNSLSEETVSTEKAGISGSASSSARNQKRNPPVNISKIESSDTERVETGLDEIDKILGGGFVPGSVILLGGEPGIGKSTLLLEIGKACHNPLTRNGAKVRDQLQVLYVTGEESLAQVHNRAKRVKGDTPNITLMQENHLDTVVEYVQKNTPDLIFIDSIQTIIPDLDKLNTGSPSQLRIATAELVDLARLYQIPILMTGHITKEGQIAGPKLLEHAVDVVLYFESHQYGQYRFIRSIKNRYGSTGEIAVFEMKADGLKEVPEEQTLLHMNDVGGVGSILFPQIEGSRAMPVEMQVLVTPASLASGRRVGENIDLARIQMIAAILEKFMGYTMSQTDIFVRVQGGIYMKDSAGDLALLLAMASSYLNVELPNRWAAAGELSLTGRIRQPGYFSERKKSLLAHDIPHVIWGGKNGEGKEPDPTLKAGFKKEYYFDHVKNCIEAVFKK